MNRNVVASAFLIFLAWAVTDSLVNAQTQADSTDHRIRSLMYVPDQVVRLRGWVGYHVDLEFEPDEGDNHVLELAVAAGDAAYSTRDEQCFHGIVNTDSTAT
jgi:type IV secretory pathway VirB9-like protein